MNITNSSSAFDRLNQKITGCTKCKRLAGYTREVARVKVKRFSKENYWGKPVPAFGDPDAKVLIIGLAPAAHGANRTGRMFTGDSSGDWLYRALYETGFANQPESTNANDGLQLKDVLISATIRCAPPQNKPKPDEIRNCNEYLHEEIGLLPNLKVVLVLGKIAFDTYRKMKNLKGIQFLHHAIYPFDSQTLICSYHPSRQNTQTGRLKWDDWLSVFKNIRDLIDS